MSMRPIAWEPRDRHRGLLSKHGGNWLCSNGGHGGCTVADGRHASVEPYQDLTGWMVETYIREYPGRAPFRVNMKLCPVHAQARLGRLERKGVLAHGKLRPQKDVDKCGRTPDTSCTGGDGAVATGEPNMNPTFDIKDLNENEAKVLDALYISAEGNGHDFGFTDFHHVVSEGITARQWPGYISSISGKDYIEIHEPHNAGNGLFTQFTWTPKGRFYVERRKEDSVKDVRVMTPAEILRANGQDDRADEVEAAQERVDVKRTERVLLAFLMNWHEEIYLDHTDLSPSISYGALATEDDETTFGDLIDRLFKARKAVEKRTADLQVYPFSMLGITAKTCPECFRESPNYKLVPAGAGYGNASIPVSACCGGDLR